MLNILVAEDGETALKIMEHEHIDLVITDIMMPNRNGYELTKLLREYDPVIPVLMVTEKEVQISQKEFFILYKLMAYPGKTFTSQKLMKEIWGWIRILKSRQWMFILTGFRTGLRIIRTPKLLRYTAWDIK